MSRVGNQPIDLPAGVDVQIDGQQVTVKGPRGELTQTFHPEMGLSRDNGAVVVARPSDSNEHKALHGLTRSLINNMVLGTSNGFREDPRPCWRRISRGAKRQGHYAERDAQSPG